MDLLSVGMWLFALSGWTLDWLSTVWPNERLVEKNPFVVRVFGDNPDPLRFGIAKLLSLAVIFLLYRSFRLLARSERATLASVAGIELALVIPAFVGVIGWYAFVHNLRIHLRT